MPEQSYETQKSVLIVDRLMTRFIKVGGIGVIVAVLGIFLFILWQIFPLFRPAAIKSVEPLKAPAGRVEALGVDSWGLSPFTVAPDGKISFVDSLSGKTRDVTPRFDESVSFSAFDYDQDSQQIAYATSDGRVSLVQVEFEQDYLNDRLKSSVKPAPFLDLGSSGAPITRVEYSGAGSEKILAVFQLTQDGPRVPVMVIEQRETLAGLGKPRVAHEQDLSSDLAAAPVHLAVHSKSGVVLVGDGEGRVVYFQYTPEGFRRVQEFVPFADLADRRVARMDFLLGGASIVFAAPGGQSRLFSLYIHEVEGAEPARLFSRIKSFADLPGPAEYFVHCLRNKAFLTGTRDVVSLRYGTTGRIRWQVRPGFEIARVVMNDKYNQIFLYEESGKLHRYELDDPHPEAGWRAFFGKVWYESASHAGYDWQSSSGSQDFEPKLSLIPLIVGTLKGTFYALFFALPIALLAALYTSQFLDPKIKGIVKPLMEIMASLPSVVLGFLAALWLAPLIENRVPSLLLILLALPPTALLCGVAWSSLPSAVRGRVKSGYEFLICAPFLFLMMFFCWHAGASLERAFFVVTDPGTGLAIADFKLWWMQTTGMSYEQRNSLVVGFMMGFAVIPIIFTITEDALSNVPKTLWSASLALGASRWQTAVRVVLPTASAGILSAIMIGVGRAVGETMIVVMATGNTPIMDMNIFSGMRTLSANIAVELPEAPMDSTLYRTLFLGAMILFLMTFTVNTLAEILRQRLREKYKTI